MPRFYSYMSTTSLLCAEVASLVGLCVILAQAIDALARVEVWSIVLVCILGTIVLINTALIYRQPQNSIKATFMVKQKLHSEATLATISASDPITSFYSIFADAFCSIFAYTEYLYQCLPDGPVGHRHVDTICYLDGSG